MILKEQRLNYTKPWSYPDVYLFTGNPVRKNNGAIVMGAGAAKEVRDNYPGIDKQFGAVVDSADRLKFVVIGENQELGWFCVKEHWAYNANLEIIAESVEALDIVARRFPQITFHMNYPGIGNGKISIIHVAPLVQRLPNNVILYR